MLSLCVCVCCVCVLCLCVVFVCCVCVLCLCVVFVCCVCVLCLCVVFVCVREKEIERDRYMGGGGIYKYSNFESVFPKLGIMRSIPLSK
uniref:Uncharacterized protein n=1 Tax=Human betaherpesvirus 6 TaxID=10368 RepID=A0A5P9SS95_9BETA|nr:hypothetical protein [Human betaherpesvirus 6]